MAETSAKVAAIAARYASVTHDQVFGMTATEAGRRRLADDLRSLSGSALRQRETKGFRAILDKVLGR